MTEKHTPGPYGYNFNPVGKTWRVIGAPGYAAIAEVFTKGMAAMIADALNEKAAIARVTGKE